MYSVSLVVKRCVGSIVRHSLCIDVHCFEETKRELVLVVSSVRRTILRVSTSSFVSRRSLPFKDGLQAAGFIQQVHNCSLERLAWMRC